MCSLILFKAIKAAADLEARSVDHSDVGAQRVAEELASAEKNITVVKKVKGRSNLNDVILVFDLSP